MAIKELQTRIALKYDSYANWTDDTKEGLGANLVLLKGELGICEIPAVNGDSRVAPTVLFKVGDGTSTFENLPWASAKAADVYSWAKASDVEVDGKTIKFIGGAIDSDGKKIDKVITLNFATPEEVAAAVKVVSDNLAGVDARVVALEGKFEGEGSVDAKIAKAKQEAIDAAASDATTKAGTAETNAKTYTNEREVEINKAIAQAKADANGYTDGKVATINGELTSLDSRLDVIEGSGEGSVAKALADAKAYAESEADAAETAAKAYADGLASNYDAAGSAADAFDDAKAYTDKEVEKLAAEDLRLAGLIGDNADAIAAETEARTGAINAINAKLDVEKVSTAIATAKQEAIDSAATTAQGKVDALENGQVKTNKEDIAGLKAADTEIRGLISAEQSRAEGIEGGLRSDVDNIKAFFATAQNETLDTALDTLKEIQDYLNGEGTATNGMLGRLTQAETDIDNLEKEFNTDAGRVKVAEGKIAALEAADTRIDGRIDALIGDNGTIATGDAATLAAAKTYAENEADAAEAAAKGHADSVAATAKSEAIAAANGYTDGKVATLSAKDTEIEGKVTTLQDIVDGYTDKGSVKAAIESAAELAQKGIDDAKAADDKAVAAQGTADAVKAIVENGTTGLGATNTIANRADAKSIANAGRLDNAEGKITALETTVDTATTGLKDRMTAAEGSIVSLQTLTAGFDGTIKAAVDAAKKTGEDAAKAVAELTNGQVATNKTNIEALDGRVTAIANDYLKAADLLIFQCGTATTVDHVAPTEA